MGRVHRYLPNGSVFFHDCDDGAALSLLSIGRDSLGKHSNTSDFTPFFRWIRELASHCYSRLAAVAHLSLVCDAAQFVCLFVGPEPCMLVA